MTCESCGDKPKNSSKDFTRAVLEINNPEQITLLRKVVIPVSMGTEEQVPAAIGKYYNVILHYEANGHTYLYSSDGIPTQIQTEIPQEIWDSLQQLNIDIDNEEDARKAADKTLQDNIDAEAKARGDADTALDGRLTTVEGIASTALQPSAIDKVVMTDISLNANSSTTTVQIDGAKENLLTGTQTTKNLPLPVASHDAAGVMNSSTFDAVANNTSNISALMNGAVAITGLSASPSQSDLTTAWETETGLTSLMNRAGIYDVDNNKVWTYYSNTSTWYAASNTSQVTINTFTNSSEGTIKGSTNVGQVFAESDGTGSVNGWDTLSGNVSTNTNNISSLQTGKQDKLTAGANITISAQNVISADSNSYTAGNAINIDENNVISADIYPGDFFTAESTVSGTGSGITLNDTLEAPIKSVDLKGDTFQQTYSGKNQLSYTLASLQSINTNGTWTNNVYVYNGITYTVNDDLTINVNGSTAANTPSYFMINNSLSLTSSTNYILNGCPSGGDVTLYSMRLYDGGSYTSDTGNGLSFTYGTQNIVRINIFGGITVTNKLFKPMIRLATVTDDTYEKFVGGIASPNPSYPQDIDVVTGEQTVQVTGKNLFDFNNGTLNFTSHITHTNDSNSVTMTATDATGSQYGIMRFDNLDATKTYKISGKAKKLVAGSAGSPFLRIVREYSDDGTTWTRYNYIYDNTEPTAGTEYSFNGTITGHQYLRLYFFNSVGTTVTVGESSTYYDVQLEEGSVTTYEPYQNQTYYIGLGSNLVATSDFEMGGMTSGVKTDSNFRITNANNPLAVLPNTTYTVSAELGSGVLGFRVGVHQLNINKGFISDSNWQQLASGKYTFTTGSNTRYIALVCTLSTTSAAVTTGGTEDTTAFNSVTQWLRGCTVWVEKGDAIRHFAPIELCKIGDYQDYIYKSGDDWYVHKEIGKQIYTGAQSEDWTSASYGVNSYYISLPDRKYPDGSTPNLNYSNLFRGVPFSARTTSGDNIIYSSAAGEGLYVRNTAYTSLTDFTTMLSSNNLISYYVLATPTDTKITDTTLIGELEALWNANTYLDTTNFFVTATGSNLPVILDVEAARKSLDGVLESIPDAQVQANWTQADATAVDYIKNKPTIPTVNDATLTIQKNGTDVATFTANASTNATANITTPDITLTTTDPGEGSALAANNFVGVYGGDPIIMDYSLNEINTGMKWITGDTIYKKTIYLGNLPNATQKTVSHGISNLKYLVHMSGGAFRPGDSGHFPLPYPSNNDTATINISAGPSDIFVVTGSDRSSMTGYVTMYYTKNS